MRPTLWTTPTQARAAVEPLLPECLAGGDDEGQGERSASALGFREVYFSGEDGVRSGAFARGGRWPGVGWWLQGQRELMEWPGARARISYFWDGTELHCMGRAGCHAWGQSTEHLGVLWRGSTQRAPPACCCCLPPPLYTPAGCRRPSGARSAAHGGPAGHTRVCSWQDRQHAIHAGWVGQGVRGGAGWAEEASGCRLGRCWRLGPGVGWQHGAEVSGRAVDVPCGFQ